METNKYIVNRDDIYVGDVCGINPEKIVIHPDGMFDYDALDLGITTEEQVRKTFEGRNYLFKRGAEQLDYGFGMFGADVSFQRTMLFVLDENNHANDLLYNSPHYPVFNISSNKDCLNSHIAILHYTYELGKVLRYFGYPEQLNYDDIVKIREHLFNCDFVLDNCELFGRYETDSHQTSYETYDSNRNHRTFNLIKKDSPLSHKYFDCLIFNRDQFIIEKFIHITKCSVKAVGYVEDVFLPNEKEGKIKSLHK